MLHRPIEPRATYFGQTEIVPIIELGEDYANKQFGETRIAAKVRDPFGYDMHKGYRARQEGGVIVSLPEAGRAYYSGKAENRWIKKPGDPRLPEYYPDHVRHAFFLTGLGRSKDKRTANADGDLIILPWDYNFEDNRGYYRLNLLLTRGS